MHIQLVINIIHRLSALLILKGHMSGVVSLELVGIYCFREFIQFGNSYRLSVLQQQNSKTVE